MEPVFKCWKMDPREICSTRFELGYPCKSSSLLHSCYAISIFFYREELGFVEYSTFCGVNCAALAINLAPMEKEFLMEILNQNIRRR